MQEMRFHRLLLPRQGFIFNACKKRNQAERTDDETLQIPHRRRIVRAGAIRPPRAREGAGAARPRRRGLAEGSGTRDLLAPVREASGEKGGLPWLSSRPC